MSVHQTICQLTDAFACPLGERTIAPFKAWPIPAPIFKWIALYFPSKWPPGIAAPPEIRQQLGGTRPVDFVAARDTLLTKLDQFAHADAPLPSHPIFGTLSRAEWMRCVYLHTDHHLRQFGR